MSMFDMEARTANNPLYNCGGDYDQAVQAGRETGLCERVKRTREALDRAIDMVCGIGGTMFGNTNRGEEEKRESRCLLDDVEGLRERAENLVGLLQSIDGKL